MTTIILPLAKSKGLLDHNWLAVEDWRWLFPLEEIPPSCWDSALFLIADRLNGAIISATYATGSR